MKRLFVIPLFLSVLLLTGCPPEKDARDAIAAAHGYIQSAQAQWGDSCRANNTQLKCTTTNKLIQAQNATATSLTVYCSGVVASGDKPYADGGTCAPVKSAQQALYAAIQNMNAIADQVKSLLAGGN